VDDITRLRDQQFIEKRAKQNIYKIFGWFRDGLLVDTAEVSAAIDMLRKETADLSSADKAGFLKEYLTTVFGSLNEEAFAALATRYVPKTDNRTLLDELFQIKPQDISAHISLLDYLGMESDIRSGTFEDVDVSTVDLKDLRKAALPAAPATAITLYQGKVLSGGAGKTIPLVDYAWIEAGSYAYKV
ncbi:MAG: hypothetical protein NTZ95_04530, partial [Candidatus Omnitrophica bacterium]|nr:hypothetical protein [Candidatus Omnitrophota bacterium]